MTIPGNVHHTQIFSEIAFSGGNYVLTVIKGQMKLTDPSQLLSNPYSHLNQAQRLSQLSNKANQSCDGFRPEDDIFSL